MELFCERLGLLVVQKNGKNKNSPQGTRLPSSMPQCREAAGTFRVQALLVLYIGGLGGKVATALLQHVWNANASGAAHQTQSDGNIPT